MIERQVAARLLATPAVTALVADRITPVVMYDDTPGPALVYRRTYGQREYTLGDSERVAQVILEVMCWAQDYATARELADLVRQALDAASWDDVEIASVADGADTWAEEVGMYGCPVNVTVRYMEVGNAS